MWENKVPYLIGNHNLHAKHFVVDNIIRLHRYTSLKKIKKTTAVHFGHKKQQLIELHRSEFYLYAFTKVLSNNNSFF